jgi:mRNA interferase RelE/StbE
MYRVEYLPAALKELRKFPADLHRRIVSKIDSLADNPRPPGSKKMSGHEVYRIRVGDYRVIYGIVDDKLLVLVVGIGNRRDVYRDY